MAKDGQTRRESLRGLLGGFVAAWAASNSTAFGQESQKLSDGDLEKRLNTQLQSLVKAAQDLPDLQGVTIPPVKIKTVKHSRQKYSDIEIEWENKERSPNATFVLARDTLADLDTAEKQRAFVASALAGHLLRLNPEKLKDVALTSFSKETMEGTPDDPAMERSMRNFVLPLRTDELAIMLMKADKSVPNANPAKDYLDMLAVRKSMESERFRDFMEARETAPTPKANKNEKDERNAANRARQAVDQLMKINGQSVDFSNGEYSANVPADYDRRMSQIEVVHPEAIVKPAPQQQRAPVNTDWRDTPIQPIDPRKTGIEPGSEPQAIPLPKKKGREF